MRTHSLYLDTSVLGGYFDDEFKEATQVLWKLQKEGRYHFISSEVVMGEIQSAPEQVKTLFDETFHRGNTLEFTSEMRKLADLYLEHKVVPLRYEDDALHVAACTIARIDYLVSWNFKHLVNVHRENGFNGVNFLNEYPSVRIISPKEIIYGLEQE